MEQSVRNSSLCRIIFLSTVLVLILVPYSFLQAQSPVGLWKFDDGRGNTATDSSGNGRDARLLNGATWARSTGALGVSANASSYQYVRIPEIDLSSTRAITVTLWWKGTFSESGQQTVVDSGSGSARGAAGFALLVNAPSCSGMQAVLRGSSGETANCYGELSPGEWHHLAAVYDKTQTAGDAIALYVDGVLQTPAWNVSSATNTDAFGDDPIYLFARQGKAEFSSGMVRDLRIYDEGLNAQQVQMDYRGMLPGSPSQAQINYVQGNYASPQTRQTTVTVRYTAAQQAGDLNVVVVGWNDTTATVSSIVDSKGNVYTRAVGPTIQNGYATQSIYYAKNIAPAAAGTNTVTVTFSTGAAYPDVRIAEYSGADTNNPVDATAANSGNGRTSSSGSVRTTNATDLLVGANLVQTLTSGPGSGFTKRLLTAPDGDILEDRMVTSTGSYSATAPLWPSGKWIMQMVAFRTPSAPVLTSITVAPSNPSISVGGHQQFTATGNYSDGSHQDLTNSATWSSSAPSVATISSTGLATGVAAGSTTIKATSGSIYGSTTLTVTAAANFTISASPTSLTVQQGGRGVSTITTAVSGGFNSSIALSASGMPSGTTVSFNPTTIPAPGNGSSTMTITVGANTAPGVYTITVAGNGGGIQRTAVVNLTVTGSSGGQINYVQGAYATPQSPQSSVSVTYTGPQYAGDLNVVVVGWNDSSAVVTSVRDSKGNVYALAVGPTVQSGLASQSIYYAKNIVAAGTGSNTVTVSFSGAARYPDIRIAEYSGADPDNPVDVTSAASGNGSSGNSGSATTTNATDLIFGANLVQTGTSGPGSGFTQRMLTNPDGDIAEDRMVSSTGSYSATAPISPAGSWIMQMVAFRTPGVSGNFSLSASPSSLTVAQGSYGTSTITATLTNGFNSSITLSASGLPTGTTATFSPNPIPAPGSGNSTMTITVGANTPGGTYPITITGNGGGIQRTTTVTLTVSSGPTFTVSASPSSLSLMHQTQGFSTITVSISNGFNNPVSLSASGVPNGTTVTFNPSTLPAPGAGNSTMTVAVGNTPDGTYAIVVTATGGGIYQTTTVNLTVTAQMMLTWTASESPGIAGYNVYRGLTSGGPYSKVNSNLVPTTNYNDVSVQGGTTYYYVTTAVTDQGQESGYSNESSGYIP